MRRVALLFALKTHVFIRHLISLVMKYFVLFGAFVAAADIALFLFHGEVLG